jgi:protein associated with RNAse G/E
MDFLAVQITPLLYADDKGQNVQAVTIQQAWFNVAGTVRYDADIAHCSLFSPLTVDGYSLFSFTES